jgi:Family of unknown function (DUF5990)
VGRVRILIEGRNLPGTSCGPSPERPQGHANIHVGVQRRNKPSELLGVVRGDAPSATWDLECKIGESPDGGVEFTGPYIQGGPGRRFIYLAWGVVGDDDDFTMFRRAKLMLDAVPDEVARKAVETGLLVGTLGLTDDRGNPVCAGVRPSAIEWSAGS